MIKKYHSRGQNVMSHSRRELDKKMSEKNRKQVIEHIYDKMLERKQELQYKNKNHLQKGLEIIMYSMLLTFLLLIANNCFHLVFSNIFYHIHTKNIEKYNNNTFYDIAIPCDVKVFFVNEIKYPNLFKDNKYLSGFYLNSKRSVFIRNSMDDEEKRSTLSHELAHDSYFNYFSDKQLENEQEEYDIVCESPNEYYAYNEQFNYNRLMMNEVKHGPITKIYR